jgi:cardiolipin synthase A/B
VLNPPPLAAPASVGGHQVRLLQGGDELFPALCQAVAQAEHEVWLASYIFHDDEAAQAVAQALSEAGRRGVRVGVVVDGFGSKATLARLREWMAEPQVALVVFRPVHRWWSLLQPGQMRRMHLKLCAVDDAVGFVGGINVIDDRNDLRLGRGELPRLDFAVELRGPLAAVVAQTTRVMWNRAAFGTDWRDEVMDVARSAQPILRARRLVQRLRLGAPPAPRGPEAVPARAEFLVRDNFRRRRDIERAYIRAINRARRRVDIICPYFYPGRAFRRALRGAARRGVRVRLLLQGKVDYRFAALAAQVLYDEMLADGVQIFEYMPAFLHAKVAVVDDDWATVGSSNIDPLSLLLNLEANVIVRDAGFAAELSLRFEAAVMASREVTAPPAGRGGWAVLRRGFVAWAAHWALRMAGITGKY